MRIEAVVVGVMLTAALILVTPLAYAVITTAIPSAAAIVYTGGTLRGWNDGYRDYHGKGWDPSCPTGHSAVYCANYKSGYNAGWSVAFGYVTYSQLWQSQPRGQSQSYQQQQQTTTTTTTNKTEGYIKGYHGAFRDFENGWRPSCPVEHSTTYCLNYQSGYSAGWSVAIAKKGGPAYKAGYEQGVSGTNFPLGKGPLINATGFGQGYVDGYCSLPGNKGQHVGSDSDQGTFDCADDASYSHYS